MADEVGQSLDVDLDLDLDLDLEVMIEKRNNTYSKTSSVRYDTVDVHSVCFVPWRGGWSSVRVQVEVAERKRGCMGQDGAAAKAWSSAEAASPHCVNA